MKVHIQHAKNRQEHFVPLSGYALDILTQYWFKCGQPKEWLFPKQTDSTRSIDTFFLSRHIHGHEERLGWPKRITCHTFRHAFGTHLYENGTDLLTIKYFLLRVEPMVKKFRGKFLYYLQQYYQKQTLSFLPFCQKLRHHDRWNEFKNKLYSITWNAEVKQSFNGNGNAVEYLGRYANRIAITNTRIVQVSEKEMSFRAKEYKTGKMKTITISCVEFIRRFMMHVLPSRFQKIRYYGFLNNRRKPKNLAIIFRIQGHRNFQAMLSELSMDEVPLKVWGYNIHNCPVCGCINSIRHAGRTFAFRN